MAAGLFLDVTTRCRPVSTPAMAAPQAASRLVNSTRSLDLSRTAVMGILNVTPDSFSDGGRYVRTDAALERALAMVDEGAVIVDIGGESTRPGAAPVTADIELARVLPVIEALRAARHVWISIDTLKPEVMRAACAAGADMINDVNALRFPGALEAALDAGAAVCLMHMQGQPRTMQRDPVYADVVAEVRMFLDQRVAACRAAGIPGERLCVDPGFGFGKTLAHNLALLRDLAAVGVAGVPLLVGVSRKSMFSRIVQRDDPAARVNGSLAAAFWALQQGARIIRCHDVGATRQVLDVAHAIALDGSAHA